MKKFACTGEIGQIGGSRFFLFRNYFVVKKLSQSSKELPGQLPGGDVEIGVNMLQKFTMVAVLLVVPPVLLTLVVLVTTYLLSVLLATSGFLG